MAGSGAARRRRSSATARRPSRRSRSSSEHGGLRRRRSVRARGRSARGWREVPGEQAAKSALDAALHDLQGKLLGIPDWRLLGLPRTGPPTSWTIWLGDPDDMARRAERGARRPVPPPEAEARRRRRPRRASACGPCARVTDLPLQVDVNEWWSLDEALDAMPQLAELGVAVRRAAAPGRRRRGRGRCAGAHRCRSTSTRTATRSSTSRAAPRSRTGSTSSWRSRAASARRSAWRMPPARSGSA